MSILTQQNKNHLAHKLYEEVLRTSNHFLHSCKTFPMEILRKEDPSYAELAQAMRKLAAIITVLADDFDPMMGQKAAEYCELMARIGVAINENNHVGLTSLVEELGKRPGA